MRLPLVMSFRAEAPLAPYRIVKFGAAGGVLPAAGAADNLLGVFESAKGLNAGAVADVVLSDAADVEFGGTVAAGAWVTSDASGRAVAATAGQQAIGRAMAAASAGEIAQILISFIKL